MELVHSDLAIMNKSSLVVVTNILVIIDELSRYTSVFFLKKIDHVFESSRNLCIG